MKLAASFLAALLLAPGLALAQEQDDDPPEADPHVLNLAGQSGLSWSTGNTKALVLNVSARSSLRIDENQLALSLMYSYSGATTQSTDDPDGPARHFVADDTLYGRFRYDRSFLGKNNAAYVGFLAFRDTSSGFNRRLMPFVGYERVLFQKEHAGELWVEGGYRFAHEKLDLDQQAEDSGYPEQRWVHGPTAFAGGKIDLTPQFSLDAGLEAQEKLLGWGDLRLNVIANALTFIGHSLSFGVNFTGRYLHEPIGARAHTDTSLQVVLVSSRDFKF